MKKKSKVKQEEENENEKTQHTTTSLPPHFSYSLQTHQHISLFIENIFLLLYTQRFQHN